MKINVSVFGGILFTLLSVLTVTETTAQNSKIFYYENEFDLSIPVKNKWSIGLGLGNRGMLQERMEGEKLAGYQHEHIELNQFTNYQSSEFLVWSLGLRYRFEEVFDDSETNEFRIIEQLEYEQPGSGIDFAHRIRLEQRFKENLVQRIRYELEVKKVLSKDYSVTADTEALFAVAPELKPEAEQRFSVGIENSAFENLGFGLSLQYRMENYTRNLAHEFFLITGFELDF